MYTFIQKLIQLEIIYFYHKIYNETYIKCIHTYIYLEYNTMNDSYSVLFKLYTCVRLQTREFRHNSHNVSLIDPEADEA